MGAEKIRPLLKAAIVSDIQAYDVREDWGMSNLAKALKLLAPFQPDVLVMPGDLADLGEYPDVYKLYYQLCREAFGGHPVRHAAIAGNHDLWSADNVDRNEMRLKFCRLMQTSTDNPARQNFNGFDFIMLTEDLKGDYSGELLDQLDKMLAEVTADGSGKPVFVVSHYAPQDTVSGSHGRYGCMPLREVFNKYPQVVSISGHMHYPLEDERNIYQDEFTAFACSTLSYGCIEEEVFNVCNTILPFAREVVQALYMEVYDDHIATHRFNVEDQRELKPDRVWSFDWPYEPMKARYNPGVVSSYRNAPAFPEASSLVLRYDYGFVYAVFDAAEHEDMVQFYRIEAEKKDEKGRWQLVRSADFVSDFYRLERNQSRRCVFKLPSDMFTAGELRRITVYPIESFGSIGEGLSIERVIPEFWRFRDTEPAYPQE